MSGNNYLTKEIEDAIIAATTNCFGLELLTRDQHLLSVLSKRSAPQTRNK